MSRGLTQKTWKRPKISLKNQKKEVKSVMGRDHWCNQRVYAGYWSRWWLISLNNNLSKIHPKVWWIIMHKVSEGAAELLLLRFLSLNSLKRVNFLFLGYLRVGRERLSRGRGKTQLTPISMGGWGSGDWGPGWGASGWWYMERRDTLHLHSVHHLRRRLLHLAATFGCQLHWSVAVCKGLAVHSRICVRLGCLHHLFMYLIWEMSTRQKFLMAWRDRKHPVLCKLKTSLKAPDPGNTRLALCIWKKTLQKVVERLFGAGLFIPRSFMVFPVHGCATAPLSRCPALPQNESTPTSPCQQVLTSWKGSEGKGSLDQGGYCILNIHSEYDLAIVVAMTICTGSLGWASLLRLTGGRAEPLPNPVSSWQSGVLLPCSSYFIYVTVWGKHLAQHLTDTYPATESW